MTQRDILLCYRRKSVVRVASDEISLEKQTAAVEALARARGLVPEWYEDAEGHKSGRTEAGRPGWQALKSQLKRPDVAGVGAFSLSRVYRNVQEFLSFLDDLEQYERCLLLVKENIDTSSAIGRAIVTILMTIYQLESDLASERRVETIAFLREKKGRHWGHAPYGCDRDGEGQLIPSKKGYWYNPTTHDATNGKKAPDPGWEWRGYHDGLLTAYRLYLDNDLSFDKLAVALNEAGWRFKNVKDQPRPWGGHDSNRVIRAWQLYAGRLPLGRQKDPRQGQPILEGGHAPIIPLDLAEAVGNKAMLRSKRFGYLSNKGKHVYLLSDVAHCATCGQPLNGNYKRGARRYTHRRAKADCPEKWTTADDVEAEVIELLLQVLTGDLLSLIRSHATDLARAMRDDNPIVAAAIGEIEQHKSRLARLTDLYVDGEIAKGDYLERKGTLDVKIAAAQQVLPDEDDEIDLVALVDQIEKQLGQLRDAKPKQKKRTINWMIARLEIGEGKIKKVVPREFVRPFF